MNGEVSRGDKAATHRGYSWSPASLSLSLSTLRDSLCPASSRRSIDICWMSSVNDHLVALIYSRNHMTSRERSYLMSQIHLVGESVFMTPGPKGQVWPIHHSPLSNWPEDFPHHSSHEQLRVTATHRCQPVYIAPSLRNRLPSHPNSMLYLHKSRVAEEGTLPCCAHPAHSFWPSSALFLLHSESGIGVFAEGWIRVLLQTEFISNLTSVLSPTERAWASPSTSLELHLCSCKMVILLLSFLCKKN